MSWLALDVQWICSRGLETKTECVVPENIHTPPPTEGIGNSWRGCQRTRNLI